jgi:hypothetical protein
MVAPWVISSGVEAERELFRVRILLAQLNRLSGLSLAVS